MEQLKDHILRILSEKGTATANEAYQVKLPRTEMLSALLQLGYNKENIELALEELCGDGTLALDELNIYQYDQPPA